MSEIKITLSYEDMIFSSQSTILHLLKEKGAPIVGTIHLQVEHGYTIVKEQDKINRSVIYTFKKVKP